MSKKGKPPGNAPKKVAKKASSQANDILDLETKRSQMRVAKARDKITKALDDPEMRAQIVAAMRRMINEGKA
jgi:citrate lyase beta subunit